MKKTLLCLSVPLLIFAEQTIDCSALFDARKEELQIQIRKLEEEQQTLQILKNATDNVLKEREKKVKELEDKLQEREQNIAQKEKEMQETLNQKEKEMQERYASREKDLQGLIQKNQVLLDQIQGLKQSKVVQTYAKMKDNKAAQILQTLPVDEAVEILSAMDTKIVGKIMSKMDPQKAGEITTLLQAKQGQPQKELK